MSLCACEPGAADVESKLMQAVTCKLTTLEAEEDCNQKNLASARAALDRCRAKVFCPIPVMQKSLSLSLSLSMAGMFVRVHAWSFLSAPPLPKCSSNFAISKHC
jgi:hypothetical protein